jgi:hypothetical protein
LALCRARKKLQTQSQDGSQRGRYASSFASMSHKFSTVHVVVSCLGWMPLVNLYRNASAIGFKCQSPKALALKRVDFLWVAFGLPRFGPASSLHVVVTNKAALAAATTRFGAAHGL